MSETKLSVKGQIVIPLRIRERMGLRAGQSFEVETMSDGTVLLIPIPDDVVGAMGLSGAERLERALAEERERDENRYRSAGKGFRRR
jgi:AbrB family looped-hinge helix DNA binding protein